MQPNKPLTKRDERRTMQELEQKRQAKTPGHADPAWMAAFYRRMAS